MRVLDELAAHQLSRPLVVTDQHILDLPPVAELLAQLEKRCSVVVFDGGQAEPKISVAEEAIQTAAGQSIDCVIGIGGGSNLDVSKVAAIVLQHGGSPSDYFGYDAVPGPVLPVFAIPTTAGTGSEVSHSAVLTNPDQQVKVSTLSRWLRPTCALVDPDLTASCPPKVTADSGIDALVHAIEAYTNRDYTEMVDVDPQAKAYEGSYSFTSMLAKEAIQHIGRSLVPAVMASKGEIGADSARAAQDEMAWAATLAGMAFSNSGVGIVHALEYPIGSLTHCGHGEGNGLLLPHVMRYNMPVRIRQFAEVARWLGAEVIGKSERKAAEAAVERIVEFQSLIGIPTTLRELGLEREQIPGVASKAFEIRRLMEINPQPVTLEDLEEILEAAF